VDAISSIGHIAGKLSPLFSLGAAGAGTVGNVMANRLRNQPLEQQLALQQKYANMTPDQFAQGIQSFLRPMSGALTSSVGNAVQANMGERGLAQAPGIFSETLAQGLAPFQTQLQQQAINAYFQSLGLPVEAAARFLPYPQGGSTASLWQNFFRQLGGPQMQGLTTNPQFPNNTNIGRTPMPGTVPGGSIDLGPGTLTPPSTDTTGSDAGTMPFDWMQMGQQGALA